MTSTLNVTDLKASGGELQERYSQFCYFMGSYIAAVVIIGSIMNSIVIIGLLRFRESLDMSCAYIINQAITDITSPVFAYPLSATSSFGCSWLYGYYGCQYYGFMTSYSGYASMINLAVLSVERYITLNFPLMREKILSARNIAGSIFIVHLTGIVWAIIPWFGVSAYVPEGVGTMCSVLWHSGEQSTFLYNLLLILGVYVLPMVVIILCYSKFLREIYLISTRAATLQSTNVSQETREIEKQQTILVLLMVVGYNIAWFPYAIVCLISVIGFPELISPIAASLPAVFAKSSNVANPIIYCLLNKRFRTLLFNSIRVSPDAPSP